MKTAEQLLADIETFLIRHAMAPSRFGTLACGDKHVVRRLRKGLGLTATRIDKLRDFMSEYDAGNARRAKRPTSQSAAA